MGMGGVGILFGMWYNVFDSNGPAVGLRVQSSGSERVSKRAGVLFMKSNGKSQMSIGLRFILCLPAVCVWLCTAYFGLKWFRHIAGGTITYGSEAAAILLPILSSLAFVGVLGSFVAVVLTCFGRMKLRWQSIIFCAGLICLWSIAGN